MTPIEQARSMLDTFDADLHEHLKNGWVFSSPLFFTMFKATRLQGKDTWYVHSLVGSAGKLMKLLPFKLPYVAFSRFKDKNKRLKIYPADRVQGLLNHIQSKIV